VNADWFYSVGDTRQGPVSEDDLKSLVAEGRLHPTDLVWKDGMPDWVEARTVSVLFPSPRVDPHPVDGRPSRRRFEDDDRPSRRRDEYDDDRPSRRGRRDDDHPDDDRPRVRRRDNDYDRYDDDRPRRKKEKPGQVQAVAIMLLVGGIFGLLMAITMGGLTCCVWPAIYYEIVWSILALIRASNMLNVDDQGPPRTLAIMQVITILNGDIVNCVLGIVSIIMLNDPKVVEHYRRRGLD
jgi:GYF domain 2